MIYVNVYQPNGFPLIEIRLQRHNHPLAGYIAAQKSIDPETGQLAPVYVFANVSFQDKLTPDEAREVADIWHIAAVTAETLDRMVATRDDLYRPIVARMMVKSVVLDWVEHPAAPARKE